MNSLAADVVRASAPNLGQPSKPLQVRTILQGVDLEIPVGAQVGMGARRSAEGWDGEDMEIYIFQGPKFYKKIPLERGEGG